MLMSFLRPCRAGLWVLAALCLPLLHGAQAEPGKPIYAWIDAAGALHATDKLSAVPEPYYTSYKMRKAALDRAQQAAARSGIQTDSPPSDAATQVLPSANYEGAALAESDARMAWKARVVAARNALLDATLALRAAEDNLAEVGRNPLLNFTPVTRARIEVAKARVEAARKEALTARTDLLVGLPERARAEHVPPQWLLP